MENKPNFGHRGGAGPPGPPVAHASIGKFLKIFVPFSGIFYDFFFDIFLSANVTFSFFLTFAFTFFLLLLSTVTCPLSVRGPCTCVGAQFSLA